MAIVQGIGLCLIVVGLGWLLGQLMVVLFTRLKGGR